MDGDGEFDPQRELARLNAHTHHFLDANLLIGFSVEWDALNAASSYYFQSASPNYLTSLRVHEEARSVIEKCRRRTLQVAEYVAEEFNIGAEYQLVDDLHGFVGQEFEDLKSPVQNYISYREDLFQQLAHNPPASVCDEIREEIRDDFKIPFAFLTKLKADGSRVQIWEDAPTDHSTVYPQNYTDVDKIMQNTADRDLLLDAYDFIERGQEDSILVTTLDRGDFIQDRIELETTLQAVQILDVLGLYREVASEDHA
jgi:hypothetical protein